MIEYNQVGLEPTEKSLWMISMSTLIGTGRPGRRDRNRGAPLSAMPVHTPPAFDTVHKNNTNTIRHNK